MIRKMFLMAATALLLAAVPAVPASAADDPPVEAQSIVNGCDSGPTPASGRRGALCFYNWIDWNKGGGFWRRDEDAMLSYNVNAKTGCFNLTTHSWTTGTNMYDNPPTSFVFNQAQQSGPWLLFMFDWVGCDSRGGALSYEIGTGDQLLQDSNLASTSASNNVNTTNYNWANRVSSVQFCAPQNVTCILYP